MMSNKSLGFRILSIIVLISSVWIIFNNGLIVNQVLRWVGVDWQAYVLDQSINFNQTQDFRYRAITSVEDNQILISESNQLKAYDYDGWMTWVKEINSKQPVFESFGTEYLVTDMRTGDLCLIGKNGDLNGMVYGDTALEMVRSFYPYIVTIDTNRQLSLYDSLLAEREQLTLPQGDLLDILYVPDIDTFYIAMLDIDDHKLVTRIMTMSLNGKILGGYTFTGDVLIEMIPYNETMICITDKKVFSIDQEGNEIWLYENDRYLGTYKIYDRSLYLSLTRDDEDLLDTRVVHGITQLRLDTGESLDIPVAKDLIDFALVNKEKIYCLYEQSLEIIDGYGEVFDSYDLSANPEALYMFDDNRFLIIYLNHMDIYRRRN